METLAVLVLLDEKYPKGWGIYSVDCKQLYEVYEGTPDDHPAIGMVRLNQEEAIDKDDFLAFNAPGLCCSFRTDSGYWIKVTTLPAFPLCALVRE